MYYSHICIIATYFNPCDLGKRFCTTVFVGLFGSNGPAPITLKLRSKNTNNRKYFHNIIFHYLKDIPHRRLNN